MKAQVKTLTDRQEHILDYIKGSIRDSGYPPTVREIGENFGITVKGAYDHLKAIEKKGHIRCVQNKSRAIEILDNDEDMPSVDSVTVPLLGSIAAGAPILAEEHITDYVSFPRAMLKSGVHFALKVRGDSMIEEGILDGDIAVIKQQSDASSGEIVAALIENEATLKILKKSAAKIELMPANAKYKPIIPSDLQILGVLAAVMRVY